MKRPRLITASGIVEAMNNLCYDKNTVWDIHDEVEQSKTGEELVKNLNSLDLLRKFELDNETETEVRLKTVDTFGNTSYFLADK